MPSRLTALTFDAHDPVRLAEFWARLLGRGAVEEVDGVVLPGSATQLGLRFVVSAEPKVGQNPMHLHLTSTSAEDQHSIVETALRLGASHLDVGQLPEEEHVVLADPEGNELCVIEPGNAYLAGCGFLGELTCEGSRDVGLFWADALGWPMVWDQGAQTAIQSPRGGTKVSWDDPGGTPKHRNRQRFDLTVGGGDLDGEVDRLVALGATRIRSVEGDAVELADPDGNAFRLRSGVRAGGLRGVAQPRSCE
ncbi:VOC family protein [Cellulomonas sp. URHD0024]|uniref:VOC family protein n=1 Tax=Cellulomonas sp. URHD0024 TaxID=1302620 RepID=UPI00040752F6|nr:glyoxalase/bleomycin resistance/extradiol dioxygenase family protein [Cellulomonas sp. URHD0024]